MTQFRGTALAGLFLAIGIAAAGYFASQVVINGRTGVNTATVKGLAERQVQADVAKWNVNFNSSVRSTNAPDREVLYQRAEEYQATVVELLKENGFLDAEISIVPLRFSRNDNRDNNGHYLSTNYFVSGNVSVVTTDLDKVTPATFAIADLPRAGIPVTYGAPSYHFNGLNAIKPDMLREATANARIAANEFASNAGVTVGGIQNASQGGFSIRDAGNGRSETESIQKQVRVVTTITFYLNN